ncbi:hypothetical protein TNCV_659161 [Trichonephila clavipes]|nr:hypothetical protein TNCV_659161 [Trichonephila clavipes]
MTTALSGNMDDLAQLLEQDHLRWQETIGELYHSMPRLVAAASRLEMGQHLIELGSVAVGVSFPEGRKQSCLRQVALLYYRWRPHLSPPPQFRGEGNILPHPASVVSAATAYRTLGPTDLIGTYSVCTRRVFRETRQFFGNPVAPPELILFYTEGKKVLAVDEELGRAQAAPSLDHCFQQWIHSCQIHVRFNTLMGPWYPGGQSNGRLTCHEFEPSTTEETPYRGAMHVKSAESSSVLHVGVVW